MNREPLNELIADTLLDGSLFADPSVAVDFAKDYQQQVALSALLGLLKRHPRLWKQLETCVAYRPQAKSNDSGRQPVAEPSVFEQKQPPGAT